MSTDRQPIAQCVASAGYFTSAYDPDDGYCVYEAYADIDRVESNAEYWARYEPSGSTALHRDFSLPDTFDRYRLTEWSDGTRTYELVNARNAPRG